MTATRTGSRKRRRLPPEARRAELLDALEQVLGEHGLAGTTVPRVVAQAGAAQGSFYRYFRDLDDAFVELAADVIEPIAQAAFALDVSKARTAAEVEEELVGYYRVLAALLTERSALLREVLLVGLSARGRLSTQLGGFVQAMRDHIRGLMVAHMGRPPFDHADPDVAAGALVGMVLGATHEAVQLGDRFDPESWARELARYETKLLCVPERSRTQPSTQEERHEHHRAKRRARRKP